MSSLNEYLALLGEAPRFAPPARGYLPAGPAVSLPLPYHPDDEAGAFRHALSYLRNGTPLHPELLWVINRMGLGDRRGASATRLMGLADYIPRERNTYATHGVLNAMVVRSLDPDVQAIPGYRMRTPVR